MVGNENRTWHSLGRHAEVLKRSNSFGRYARVLKGSLNARARARGPSLFRFSSFFLFSYFVIIVMDSKVEAAAMNVLKRLVRPALTRLHAQGRSAASTEETVECQPR